MGIKIPTFYFVQGCVRNVCIPTSLVLQNGDSLVSGFFGMTARGLRLYSCPPCTYPALRGAAVVKCSSGGTELCITCEERISVSGNPWEIHYRLPAPWCSSRCFAAPFRLSASVFRTAVVTCPLDNLQMHPSGCLTARCFIPWAAVFACPLENLQMTPSGCLTTYAFIPRAAVVACPSENL